MTSQLATDAREQAEAREHGAAAPRSWRSRRRRRPVVLLTCAALMTAALLLPLVFLLIEARGAGVSTMEHLIFRPLTGELLWNTVRLTVAVTALSAVIGTAAAWCTERTDLPGRSWWAVLVVVPLAIPDFVVSFGWYSLWTWMHGFRGAVIVLTLAVYPLVYLPVAASLRSADPGQEEVARSLGNGRVRTFVRITLAQARGAILGGCLLVALVLLAEYGAFEILGYQTFTTEIFTEFNSMNGFAAACALSLVLVLLSLLVLAGEGMASGPRQRGQVGAARPAQGAAAPARPRALAGASRIRRAGAARARRPGRRQRVLDGSAAPRPRSPAASRCSQRPWHTAGYGALAAAVATVATLPVALLAVRHAGRVRQFLERSSYLVLAMPGIVIAFALTYFVEIYAHGIGYGTSALLIICYSIMFFPLALVGVKASLARAPVKLDEMARSLGVGQVAVLWRITLRLAGPGLMAAFCLVFLSVVTELTATLLLIPTGVQTLATQFWVYQTNLSYGQAAPFALVMIGVAAVPSYVLGRFFNRTASRARTTR